MPSFIFTKMIVADLERETAFFEQVIGLKTVMRMVVGEGDAAADEVILSADGKPGGVPSLALLCYRRRPAPAPGELVLGFMVDDADAVAAAAERGGGRILMAPRDVPDHGLRVGFVADPEGHEIEIVQPLAP
jgi:predicted enzyme related to lactoylglutathione lyase